MYYRNDEHGPNNNESAKIITENGKNNCNKHTDKYYMDIRIDNIGF